MNGLSDQQPAPETKTQVILYFCEGSLEEYGKTPEAAIMKTIHTLGIHGIIHEFTEKPWCHPKAVVRQVPASYKER